MRSNYKKLGSYIQQVDIRNKDNKVNYLRGISSIYKELMPSKANIVGTDMSKYKIVQKGQFAFNPNTARMGDKIPIALNLGEPCIVSQIYPVFEIIDETKLLPEYLIMWFKREEFDRYARYKSHGSAREIFDWEEMCDVELPIPSIEKQREIVAEYYAITNRIKLNEQLNQKLEETAQAIYKEWFVDFEFPHNFSHSESSSLSLSKCDSESDIRPYKSGGGEMVWCEELEKEIPKGWGVVTLESFTAQMKSGGTPNRAVSEYWNSRDIPWVKTGELQNKVLIEVEEYISEAGCKNSSAKILPINTILIAMYGQGNTKGQVAYTRMVTTTNQACCAMICENEQQSSYLFNYLKFNRSEIVNLANGGAQPNLSKELIATLKILKPSSDILQSTPFIRFINHTEILTREISKLLNLRDILFSKMATVEG